MFAITKQVLDIIGVSQNKVDFLERNKLIGIPFDIIKTVKGNKTLEWISDIIKDYKLDDKGNLIWYRDIYGDTHHIKYDESQKMIEQFCAFGSISWEYDQNDRIIKQIHGGGGVYEFKYDQNGNQVEVTFCGNIIEQWNYYANNLLESRFSELLGMCYYYYDEQNRVIFVQNDEYNEYHHYNDDGTKTIRTVFIGKDECESISILDSKGNVLLSEENGFILEKWNYKYYPNGQLKSIFNGLELVCEIPYF